MNSKPKSDRNLTKLKLALATGGLMATVIGAGLLGQEAMSMAEYSSSNTESTIRTGSRFTSNFEITSPEDLDLNLEAVPTVTAPTMRSPRVAVGRSSG